MKKLLYLFLVFTSVSFFSCSDPEKEEMISKIDNAYATIKEAEVTLLSIDTVKINEMIKYNNESLNFIQNKILDTVPKEEGIFISDIVAVKRSFNKLLTQYDALVSDMIYAKSQLDDLKKDVEAGFVSKENFNSYFEKEKQAIDLFVSSVDGLVKWEESNIKRFEKMKPEIEKYKEKLNKSEL